MQDVQLKVNDKGRGEFFIAKEGDEVAEMEIQINKDNLTVYHTEVAKEEEGKGLAKKLLDHMVDYARTHKLKVVPLCPYVYAQFKKHRAEYADLWDGK
jgi:predicted GNAT family acetyltransferase